jgi:hypothetical protein
MVTGKGLERWGLVPGRGKISFFSIASRLAIGPTHPPIQWVLGPLSPKVKWQGCKADHSTPTSAEVKNGEAIRPLPHMSSWHSPQLIKCRDNFTLLTGKACPYFIFNINLMEEILSAVNCANPILHKRLHCVIVWVCISNIQMSVIAFLTLCGPAANLLAFGF